MQAKLRYCVLVVAVLSFICLFVSVRDFLHPHDTPSSARTPQRSALPLHALHEPESVQAARKRRDANVQSSLLNNRLCTMQSCFNFTKCAEGFKVYVYEIEEGSKISNKYREILTLIRQSRFYTTDASEACLFVISIDTLDRDKLSTDYVSSIGFRLENLPLWNNGENHILFNLYSGTWPDYSVFDFGFDIGKAILAQASLSQEADRRGFDISFPLYHADHPVKGGEPGYLVANNVPPVRQYTLSFKGKRYIVGIGSDSRNALYHIHNGKDIILLTTCKHKGVPKELYDERCTADEEQYDKWDYKVLMHNSTFCLVPRGRRLASYRFLESLQAGCIPVLLSNEYVLPFNDVIDWSRAAVWADERLLLQIPSLVRSISHTDILSLRQQTQLLWENYFSSTQKIVQTTLEIIAERVARHFSRPVRNAHVWNSHPGALVSLPEYSAVLAEYPFYASHTASHFSTLQSLSLSSPLSLRSSVDSSVIASVLYTAVIVTSTSPLDVRSPVYRLIKNLAKSQYLHQIILLWRGTDEPPDGRWKDITVKVIPIKSPNERFYPFPEIQTQAVLSLDENVAFTADEADFGFSVWRHHPERLVGFLSRSHYWHESRNQWAYSSRPTPHYSMVLTSAAFYHKYYGYAYHNVFTGALLDISHQYGCGDILINFLVSHVTKLPPIRLLQHKWVGDSLLHYRDINLSSLTNDAGAKTEKDQNAQNVPLRENAESDEQFRARQRCMHEIAELWGDMPLRRSQVRIDPVLYRDDVSVMRKKYRQLEHLPQAFAP